MEDELHGTVPRCWTLQHMAMKGPSDESRETSLDSFGLCTNDRRYGGPGKRTRYLRRTRELLREASGQMRLSANAGTE
jgi:hypothetical protein